MQSKLIAFNNSLTLNFHWFIEVVFSAIIVETISLYEGARGRGERAVGLLLFLSLRLVEASLSIRKLHSK